MHPSKKAQIAHLKADEALSKVSSKYADFADVFSLKLALEFLEYTKINNYTIKLIDNQQPLYSSIYNLGSVKLEILKVYIENNLANSFIKLFKSLVRTLIFYGTKSHSSLGLYVDYQGLNHLTIKN